MVGVGPTAVDVDGADGALVPLWKLALASVVYLELSPMYPWFSAGVS
jgi:hypothetical protein